MKSSSRGFTIVETLIVLAIAGLILLIVFQAIPSLERNSRNNQRRQDVQTILAAISRWELNNSGNIPSTPTDDFLFYYQSKLTYYPYDSGYADIQVATETPGLASLPNDPNTNTDKVYVYNYQKCDTTSGGGSTSQGAGYSDIVALFALESASGPGTPQCQQL